MKKAVIFILSISLICMLTACTTGSPKVIEENEKKNEAFISAAVSAMSDQPLCLIDALDWGDDYQKVKDEIPEPYIQDDSRYLSKGFFSALPSDENWLDDNGNINKDAFSSIDTLSYFAMDSDIGLYEYGYLLPDANLYQYDFLKEYYTKKYGPPAREDWEWKDRSYTPTGDEDYYQLFAEGKVKVITVWDIESLDTVLVIDWLNDPIQYDNNYGQISFYSRTDDFSTEQAE